MQQARRQADQATLDPAVYRDPGRFARERDRLFRRLPLCLGHADQLAQPGSVLAYDICGVPVLMTRARDGAVRVFLNVCRHRGARLVVDEGVLSQAGLSCPYHGWTYRLDGALAGVPVPKASPRWTAPARSARAALGGTPGLIWAVLDPDADKAALDIAGYLGALDRDLRRRHRPAIASTASMPCCAPPTGS